MQYGYSAFALLISLTIARPAAATILNFAVALNPGYSRSGPVPASTVTFTLDTSTAVPDPYPFQTGYLDLDPVLVTVVSAGAAAISYSAVPVLELAQAGGNGDLTLITPTTYPYYEHHYTFFSTDQNNPQLVTANGSEISFLEGAVPIGNYLYLVQTGVATISESSTPIPEPAGFGLVVAGLTVAGFIRRRRPSQPYRHVYSSP